MPKHLYLCLIGLGVGCATPNPVDPTPDYASTYECTFKNTSIDHQDNDRVWHYDGSFTNLVFQVADQTVEFRNPEALYGVWATVRSNGFTIEPTIVRRWKTDYQGRTSYYNLKVTGAGTLTGSTLRYNMRYLQFPIDKPTSDSTMTILSACTCQKK